MTEPHYLAIWEFHVKTECASEFERVYGSHGPWAQLFRRSPEYLGTELVRDLSRAGRYLTMDRWTSHEALGHFKRQFAEEYAALDKECERMTQAEAMIGDFELTAP